MKMKKILERLFEHKTLSQTEAFQVLFDLGKGCYNEHEITAFMTVFLMRSITIDELRGFSDALMALCIPADIGSDDLLDIVGTGGDGKHTFNISTLASFVVAGAGQKVAKHGNYGASTISGASNVMEQMGYRFSSESDKLRNELDAAGICFLHAPLFHPALKQVGQIRKNLGIRTFFNLLGPLVNPAKPAYQLIGVFSLEMARIYQYFLQQTDRRYTIVHGLDGYDEIALTNDTRIITPRGAFNQTPEQLGKRRVFPEDLQGGASVEEAASIFVRILRGEGSWAQQAVVLANAATGLFATEKFISYEDAYQAAVESLDSGKAFQTLQKLIALQ